MNTATAQKPRKDEITATSNFGDFQNGVYAEALRGVSSRYPFDFASIERKASETLPEWVYRYVSAASGDGRTQRANVDAFSRYGIVPRMMVSPLQRDLSIDLFGKRLASPIFMSPVGLVGLCAPDFLGDVAAAQASAATAVPFTIIDFLAVTDGGRHQARGGNTQFFSAVPSQRSRAGGQFHRSRGTQRLLRPGAHRGHLDTWLPAS